MDKHILVIEDEAAIREIITVPLEAQGYKVTAAADGLEGITAFRSAQFDLVLLDIMMPKIDGYTVCEMIRKESDVPVILLTALDRPQRPVHHDGEVSAAFCAGHFKRYAVPFADSYRRNTRAVASERVYMQQGDS